MKARCYNPTHPAFKYYGAQGVKVCDRWRHSFAAFLADVGEAPSGLWIDRIDNSKGYEPGNVRWVTPKVSANNRRQRQAKAPAPDSIRALAAKAGLSYHAVYQRVKLYGWPLEKALTIPPQKRGGMPRALKQSLGVA